MCFAGLGTKTLQMWFTVFPNKVFWKVDEVTPNLSISIGEGGIFRRVQSCIDATMPDERLRNELKLPIAS